MPLGGILEGRPHEEDLKEAKELAKEANEWWGLMTSSPEINGFEEK